MRRFENMLAHIRMYKIYTCMVQNAFLRLGFCSNVSDLQLEERRFPFAQGIQRLFGEVRFLVHFLQNFFLWVVCLCQCFSWQLSSPTSDPLLHASLFEVSDAFVKCLVFSILFRFEYIVCNLACGIDVEETEAEVAAFKERNAELIERNKKRWACCSIRNVFLVNGFSGCSD